MSQIVRENQGLDALGLIKGWWDFLSIENY
jgi:hypothetical protein